MQSPFVTKACEIRLSKHKYSCKNYSSIKGTTTDGQNVFGGIKPRQSAFPFALPFYQPIHLQKW